MAKKIKLNNDTEKRIVTRPALTPEARENQLISYAMDLVEQRLLNGTASSQETTHFLKLGSIKHREELERIRLENDLIKAKTKNINSMETSEQLYKDAIAAFQMYSGNGNLSRRDEYEEDY